MMVRIGWITLTALLALPGIAGAAPRECTKAEQAGAARASAPVSCAEWVASFEHPDQNRVLQALRDARPDQPVTAVR